MAYDGIIPPDYYGVPCRQLAPNSVSPLDMPPLHATGVFVISALTTSGIAFEPGHLHPYAAFRDAKPVTNSGGAMLVYEGTFDLTTLAAVTHTTRSNTELASNPREALEEAQAAVQFMPASVRAHMAAGKAYGALNNRSADEQEFQQALTLAQGPDRDFYPVDIIAANHELQKLKSQL